jgi:hypothetical protein
MAFSSTSGGGSALRLRAARRLVVGDSGAWPFALAVVSVVAVSSLASVSCKGLPVCVSDGARGTGWWADAAVDSLMFRLSVQGSR